MNTETTQAGAATARPWRQDETLVRPTEAASPRTAPLAQCALSHGLGDAGAADLANAALIVRAVNAHDALVEALATLLDDIRKHARGERAPGHLDHIRSAHAALALARGESRAA